MKKRSPSVNLLFNLSRFFSFALVVSLVVSTSMLLFLRNMDLDEQLVRENALYTFFHVIIITFLGCIIDAVRRHLTLDRPLRQITDALNSLSQGDYDQRLDTRRQDFYQAGFWEISTAINDLAKELSGVDTLRNDFIASVSHELKTPLAAISNYARLLQTPGLSEESREEYTRAIYQTSHRLADLISNILKLNKLENQQIYPETRIFDLSEQLCESMLEYESVWEEKQLELECELADGVLVEADPELLKLVWSNLFSNAVKFTPPGGRICLRLTADGPWACVSVADTGCGMNQETGSRIFEKFYQGDTAHATKGNGLGLALVKRVVDITGGAITVNSAPGRGSTFTVRLGRVENGAG